MSDFQSVPQPLVPAVPPAIPPGFAPGGPLPAPAKKKRRVGLILGIVAGVLVVCLGGVGVAVYQLVRTVSAPRDAVDAWLSAGRSGDIDQVRALTCALYAGEYDAADFDNEATRSLTWVISGSSIGPTTATVTVDVTYTHDGTRYEDRWTFDLIKEGDAWKYCGLATDGGLFAAA
jgi:hypothetical protein